MIQTDLGVNRDNTAYGSDLHGKRRASNEFISLQFPRGQGLVVAILSCISMGTGLHGSPVLSHRDQERIHPVHETLVVGCCAVRVHFRKYTRAFHTAGDRHPHKVAEARSRERIGTRPVACTKRWSARLERMRR